MAVSILKLTSGCISQILKICSPSQMLRISVDAGGCNGFQYLYSIDNKIMEDDIVIEDNLAKIVIDKLSIDFIKDATVDYKDEIMRSGFVIDNPNIDSSCGCKISFSINLKKGLKEPMV